MVLVLFLGVCLPVFSGEPVYSTALLKKYSPVIVQIEGRIPLYDKITNFDFDGNVDGADNVLNSNKFPIQAGVYGQVVAETSDSFYLFYGVYHLKDYDRPLREWFFRSAVHDNDFEGAMVNVSRETGEIRAVETWFHNMFVQCSASPLSAGDQTVDARLNIEDGTHVILYVQSDGHGVRCFQKIDEADALSQKHLIYREGNSADELANEKNKVVSYKIIPFEIFLKNANGPFAEGAMFSDPDDFGLNSRPIGKYLTGRFQGNTSWARPKPPWSWADKFDSLRYGSWFFHPAYVFNKHFGLNLSETYSYNVSLERLVDIKQEDLNIWVSEKREEGFFGSSPNGWWNKKISKLRQEFYRIMEPLFFYFG